MTPVNRIFRDDVKQAADNGGWVEKDGKLVHEDSGTTIGLGSAPDIEYVNSLTLIKGKEKYAFFYDKGSRGLFLKTITRFANDDELSFSFYDAAVLSQKMRQSERRDDCGDVE